MEHVFSELKGFSDGFGVTFTVGHDEKFFVTRIGSSLWCAEVQALRLPRNLFQLVPCCECICTTVTDS